MARSDDIGGGGGDDGRPERPSYSDRLKTNVRYNQRLKRNVLEITLEKSNPTTNIRQEINDANLDKLFKTLGMNTSPGLSSLPGRCAKD